MTPTLPVIDPIVPVLSRETPRGREWRYEVKERLRGRVCGSRWITLSNLTGPFYGS